LVTHVPLHGDVAAAYEAGVARIGALADQLVAPLSGGALALEPDESAGVALASSFSRPDFERAVERAKEHIRAGDAIQIVLAGRRGRRGRVSAGGRAPSAEAGAGDGDAAGPPRGRPGGWRATGRPPRRPRPARGSRGRVHDVGVARDRDEPRNTHAAGHGIG